MNDSTFDPNQFLDATTTEALSRRPAIPAGSELTGIIQDISSQSFQGKQDPTKTYVRIDVKILCDTSALAGQPPSVLFVDGVMIDRTEAGQIDTGPGKNGKLRRYREATGLNTPGQAFSPRQLVGRQVRVKTKVEPYEGELYDRVDSVAKI